MLEHGLDGKLEMAIVKSVEPEKFRGIIQSLDTGSLQTCIMNPSPYCGIMPTEGTLVAVYRKQGWSARYLFPISEIVDTSERSIEKRLEGDLEEPLGAVEYLDAGESFYGRSGRLRFDNQGSVFLTSKMKDISLKLSHQIKRAELTANDFMFSTHGAGIRIMTKGSVPLTYGDTLRIEKNVSTVTIPKEVSKLDAPVPTISYIEIDKVGGIGVSATLGAASLELSRPDVLLGPNILGNVMLSNPVSSLKMDPLGDIRLKNKISYLELSPIGDIALRGPVCEFSMSATNNVILSNQVGSLSISAAGITQLTSQMDMTLIAGTSFLATASTTINLLASTSVTMTATQLNFVGIPNFLGAPASIPLIGAVATKLIPVTVNGVLIGSIPVI